MTRPTEPLHDCATPSTEPRLRPDDRGQELIEYALLATFVSLAGIAGIAALQGAITFVFSVIAAQLN